MRASGRCPLTASEEASPSRGFAAASPSRAALLTGRAAFDAYNFGSVRAVPTFTRHVSLPEKLRLAGYATTAVWNRAGQG